MKYFGNWGTNNAAARCSVPVNATCNHCTEPIAAHDSGVVMQHQQLHVLHRECFMRLILGSVGHQQHTCSCHGGTCEDPPELTLRQSAQAAVAYFEATLPTREDYHYAEQTK